MRIVKQSAELLWVTPNAAKEIEMATRTCYKSEDNYDPAKTEAFLERIVNQNHHESVIEHGVASFRIICDRGVSHEIVRHRLASYSQESTRYCNYGKDKFGKEITVIMPPDLGGFESDGYYAWIRAMDAAETAYFKMLEAGCKPQIARSVLPTCLKTELVMTANMREWRHFIKLRTAASAHPQIREIAFSIQDQLAKACPELFKAPQSS